MKIVKGLLGLSQSRPQSQTKTEPHGSWLTSCRRLIDHLWQSCDGLVIVPGVAAIAIGIQFTGAFQFLEWATLDHFFRLRPLEAPDSRIIVITISESDITEIGDWPISDAVLAQLLDNVHAQKPSAIGLDLYRNLPVEPGHQDWVKTMKNTPELIGVEKVVGEAVAPAPVLAELGQVAMSDVVLDGDGKVRRGLLSIQTDTEEVKLGLATAVALQYLESQDITLTALDEQMNQLQLGKTTFTPLDASEGGYSNTDTGGYQILLNYRGPAENFETVSFTEVLKQQIAPDLFRDRMVFIGMVAESLKDPFQTPYHGTNATAYNFTPGVFIHANLTSQIVNAALDGRTMLRGTQALWNWSWIVFWSFISVIITRQILLSERADKAKFSVRTIAGVGGTCGVLLSISFGGFLLGWWLPVVSPLLAIIMGAVGFTLRQYAQSQRLSSVDGLTQLANRRFFDQYLAQRILERQPLSLLICDVDFFKKYNDEYGHQAGDRCLQAVAKAIAQAVREGDFAARYGGEEFVVVLPNTNATVAIQIAERVRLSVLELQIPHCRSDVDPSVTLSGGLAIMDAHHVSSQDFIEYADQALYEAKRAGRNQIFKKVIVPLQAGYQVYQVKE